METNTPKIRVLIADDHAAIRRGLHRLLETEPDFQVIGMASDGPQTVELARQLGPDVVVLDVKMPLLSGIEAGRAILATAPATKLLMISAGDEKALVEECMAMGASGYLAKECSLAQVPAAIRQIVAGSHYLCLISHPSQNPWKNPSP